MRNLSVTHPVEVDHFLFDLLLARHVRHGLVDYHGFRDAAEFTRYLAYLESGRFRLKTTQYDWGLNTQRQAS